MAVCFQVSVFFLRLRRDDVHHGAMRTVCQACNTARESMKGAVANATLQHLPQLTSSFGPGESERCRFFPTCQVRVVRFYVSCLLLLLGLLPPPPRPPCPPPAPLRSMSVCPAGPQPRPSTPRPVFPAGPQPRPSTPSVPCRTSTTTFRAQCSLPDGRTSTASIHAKCSLPDLM